MAKKTTTENTKPGSAAERTLRAIAQVRGDLGKQQVQLSRKHLKAVWPYISPGNVKLEYILGGAFDAKGMNSCPGYPRGRITNIYGKEHCGKTSLCLHAAAETCARGGCVCYIDYEHVLDIRYAAKLGVPVHDPSKFLLFQPETLEQGIGLVCMAATNKMDLVVLDSVGAAVPKSAFEVSIEEMVKAENKALGLQARVWSSAIPMILHYLNSGGTAMLAVAQQRDNISAKGSTVVGGNAWKYYSAVRIEMRQISQIKGSRYNPMTHKMDSEAILGSLVSIKVKKAKLSGTSNYEAVIECLPDVGFDPFRVCVDLAVAHGIVKKAGSWYSWEHAKHGEIKQQGLQGFITALRGIPGIQEELDTVIRPFLRSRDVSPSSEDEEPDYHDEEGAFVEGALGEEDLDEEEVLSRIGDITEGKFSIPSEDEED